MTQKLSFEVVESGFSPKGDAGFVRQGFLKKFPNSFYNKVGFLLPAW
jgi:hypothetical protein